MEGLPRQAVAIPLLVVYGGVALFVGGVAGIAGVALVAVGAGMAAYALDSVTAFLVALPAGGYGVANLGDPGPLENTSGGWGAIILVAVALPLVVAVAAGLLLRSRRS